MEADEEEAAGGDLRYLCLQPVRKKLLDAIADKGGTGNASNAYIAALANACGYEPALVTYHLNVLEQHGLVESRYEMREGRMHKPYTITALGKMMLGVDGE